MHRFAALSCLFFNLLLTNNSFAQTFQSSNTTTQLIELYSSQGCSSCPAAERWVSKQLKHPGLWHEFIPIVFHVDYWNSLGWVDPFSQKQYSQRQRNYYSQGCISSVYTPGILVNGQEWRGWYRSKPLPESVFEPGTLTAVLKNNKLHVSFQHIAPLVLNVVLLGFNILTDVKHGENAGHTFYENFIVLKMKSYYSTDSQWNIEIDTTSDIDSKRYALAVWVNTADNIQPLQATGGWILSQ